MRITTNFLISAFLIFLLTRCDENRNSAQVDLSSGIPTERVFMKWSPKAEKLLLLPEGDRLVTALFIGPSTLKPVRLELFKNDSSVVPNCLVGDWNRNGTLSDDSVIVVNPIVNYQRLWSVFKACVYIPVKEPESSLSRIIPYYLEFWHISDSMDQDEERLLRYTRNGWMEGEFEMDTVKCRILLSEMVMDGVYNTLDHWSLCDDEAIPDLYSESKQCNQHIWIGNRAFSLSSIDPTGLRVSVKEVFPEKTQEQEIAEADKFLPDRNAKRSGQTIPFLHDYAEALKVARQLNKPLFVDFETTWCDPCSKMNKWVYTADKVVALSSGFVFLKVDGTQHPDLVKKFRVEAYPTMVILDRNGVELKRKIGYCSVNEMVSLTTTL